VISSVESVGATRSAKRRISWKRRDLPIGRVTGGRGPPLVRRISALSCLFSTRIWRNSQARRRIASSSSFENGFCR
jgi:hypothetical protein